MKAWELMGRAIKDYFYGDQKAALITDSDCAGREEMPVAVFFRTNRQLSDLERYALSICKGNTLDVGAGAGCHSLILQKRRLPVTALDISPDAVFTMTQRGVEAVVCEDICHYYANTADPIFDTVFMLMNGIGVVGDLKGLERYLTGMRRLLKPEGQLLFDSADLRLVETKESGDDSFSKNQAGYYGIVNYNLEYRGIRSDPFTWLYLDQRTLKKYAAKTGWDFQIIYEEGYQYLARLIMLG